MSRRETPRDKFIRSVGQALGQANRQAPGYSALQVGLAEQEQKVAAIRQRLAPCRGELMAQLEHTATRVGWRFVRAGGADQAVDYILGLAKEHSTDKVARTDHPIFQRLPLDDKLTEHGLEVVLTAGYSRPTLREQLQATGLGITGVEYAIAETGSCVLSSRPGVSRAAWLLPAIYVAVVEADQVVETLDDILAFRRLEYLQSNGSISSHMSFITGPSRTGDIEQVIVIGAHGPRQTHMIVLDRQ